MNENKLVKKSNNMIQAIGNTTLLANKVMLASLLLLEERDGKNINEESRAFLEKLSENGYVDFSRGLVAEIDDDRLRKWMGVKSGSYYKSISDLINSKGPNNFKNQWSINIKDDVKKIYANISIVKDCVYFQNKLFIKFSDEKKIREDILKVKSDYSLLEFDTFMKFKSTYSFRIYEMLVSMIGQEESATGEKKDFYSFTFNLAELKYQIGVLDASSEGVSAEITKSNPCFEEIEKSNKSSMPRFVDFKRYCLDKVKAEIDEKTDYLFNYIPLRNGKGGKVVEVELSLTRKTSIHDTISKQNQEINERELTTQEKDDLVDEVRDLLKKEMKTRELRAICEKANYNIEKIKEKILLLDDKLKSPSEVLEFLISELS